MKSTLIFLLSIWLTAICPAETGLTEAEATATARQWAGLLTNSDVNGLETLLAADYVHTHGTGKVESKQQFVEALRSGARKYERCEMKDLRFISLGNTAMVHGSIDVQALARGKTIEGNYRFLMVVTKTDQGIKVVSYQAKPTEKRD